MREEVGEGERQAHKWPLAECSSRVLVTLGRMELPETAEGVAELLAAAAADMSVRVPVEFRREDGEEGRVLNPVSKKAIAIHIVASGARCGYVLASENRKVRVEGAATAMLGADGWVVDAAEAESYKIAVSDGWELRGRLVEVKSEKDNAWTEQRIWIRSLTEPGFINYDNPYLFDGEQRRPSSTSRSARCATSGRSRRRSGRRRRRRRRRSSRWDRRRLCRRAAAAEGEGEEGSAAEEGRREEARRPGEAGGEAEGEGEGRGRREEAQRQGAGGAAGSRRVAGGARPCGLRLGRRRREEA